MAATIYYGGSSWNQSGSSAAAATLINQSSQIQGAIEAYKTDNDANVPSSMSDLINGGYLNAAPNQSWNFSTDAVVTQQLDQNACIKANNMLGYTYGSTIPSCSDPTVANKTVCCQ
ncbi:MAG TPA: hypothetical protein VJS30_11340 [Paraburkholderia sp.]|nr:hypothetical protein [Paraburkholderia sp.]